jgi:hypothetical protein
MHPGYLPHEPAILRSSRLLYGELCHFSIDRQAQRTGWPQPRHSNANGTRNRWSYWAGNIKGRHQGPCNEK